MKNNFPETVTLEKIVEYLKIGKFVLYKMVREGKIPAVKIENVENSKIIIRNPYNQELIKKIK